MDSEYALMLQKSTERSLELDMIKRKKPSLSPQLVKTPVVITIFKKDIEKN